MTAEHQQNSIHACVGRNSLPSAWRWQCQHLLYFHSSQFLSCLVRCGPPPVQLSGQQPLPCAYIATSSSHHPFAHFHADLSAHLPVRMGGNCMQSISHCMHDMIMLLNYLPHTTNIKFVPMIPDLVDWPMQKLHQGHALLKHNETSRQCSELLQWGCLDDNHARLTCCEARASAPRHLPVPGLLQHWLPAQLPWQLLHSPELTPPSAPEFELWQPASGALLIDEGMSGPVKKPEGL